MYWNFFSVTSNKRNPNKTTLSRKGSLLAHITVKGFITGIEYN